MSKLEELADALDNWDGLLMMPIGWRQQTSDALRRLAQVEAEHAALLKAISDAEPVAMVTTKRYKNKAHSISFGPFGGVYELHDGDYKLYTLNGIKKP